VAKIKVNKNLCKGCNLCIIFCPKARIKSSKTLNERGIYEVTFIDKEGKCTGCAQCAIICPETAIEVYK
jgi:2-oxoglutarate ferredoxin oxidoreductase subunit delta